METAESFQVQERKRVLVIYSLDHLLYQNLVLKFCALLLVKCGTEVVLDLLDSVRLGALGAIQRLDQHSEQIEGSSVLTGSAGQMQSHVWHPEGPCKG